MGTILIVIGGAGTVIGAIRLMIRMDRVNRERVVRRREDWRASGGTGEGPADYMGNSGGTGNY